MRIRRLPALGALALTGCSTTAAGLTQADRTGLPDHACLLGPVTKSHGCHVSHGLPDRACTPGTVSTDVARGELRGPMQTSGARRRRIVAARSAPPSRRCEPSTRSSSRCGLGSTRPGQIYLTEHTAALLGAGDEFRELGAFDVKGADAPVGVVELVGGELRTRHHIRRAASA